MTVTPEKVNWDPVLAYIHRDLMLEFRQVRAFCLREATSLINPARDRVIGVGFGVFVMWFVFDQFWPARTSTALGDILRNLDEAVRESRKLQREGDATTGAP